MVEVDAAKVSAAEANPPETFITEVDASNFELATGVAQVNSDRHGGTIPRRCKRDHSSHKSGIRTRGALSRPPSDLHFTNTPVTAQYVKVSIAIIVTNCVPRIH